jgi:hypothetical protein
MNNPERKCLSCSHTAVDGMLYCVYHLSHFHESCVLIPLAQELEMEVSGNGPFLHWFVRAWPEPKSKAQKSNWKYKRDVAHAAWCAALNQKVS